MGSKNAKIAVLFGCNFGAHFSTKGYIAARETQNYYFQSRYYSPEVGRFLNADANAATGQGQIGCNMFAYCGNNPVNRLDPTGNAWWHWVAAAVVVAVAAVAVVATAGGAAAAVTAVTAVANGAAATSKEVLKTAISPKKVAMYTAKLADVDKTIIVSTVHTMASGFISNIMNNQRKAWTNSVS